jgi:serine-type D-Ala-D-Ala carboxypeptidase (penicillin-binding protein 5/6)
MTELHPKKHHYRLVITLTLIALGAILFLQEHSRLVEKEEIKKARESELVESLEGIELVAKAVSVFDVKNNREIYGMNSRTSLPIASLVKTMTVLTALNSYAPDALILLSKDAISQKGDFGLRVDEKWNPFPLAKFTLIGSVNDSAYALVENVKDEKFLERMNEKAKKIGLEEAEFKNVTGLDEAGQASAFASARDANIMASFAILRYPEIFYSTTLPELTLESESGQKYNIKNTDIILDKIPNLVFSKTGYTEKAGGNLTIIFKTKSDDTLAVTVLGSTWEGRFQDMEKLVNALYVF